MEQISELRDILNGYFHWNKARMMIFVSMLLALVTTRTVNLTKMVCAISGNANLTSRYRRLQRFFAEFVIDLDMIAGFIVRLFFISGGDWYLAIDRTNWKWGKKDINILALAIVYKGIAIPIYWELLDTKGNSDTPGRIALLQKFIKQFGKNCIAGILADREFVGNDWFGWLLQEQISFRIRIKQNFLTTNSRGQPVHVRALFRGLPVLGTRILYGKRQVLGHELYLAGLRLVNGDLLIVATDQSPGNAIQTYGLRWEIETLFGCLKSKGFHFEETHITDQARIKKLLALLAIAFCWCHKIGEWQHEVRPIKIKTHERPAVSLFRYGLDYIVDAFLNLFQKSILLVNCFAKLKLDDPVLSAMGQLK